MIQIIYSYPDEAELRETLLGDGTEDSVGLGHPFVPVPEMLAGAYMTVLEPEEVSIMIAELKQPPEKMEIISSHNMDGTHYEWTKPQEIQRNHSVNKYKNRLNHVVEYNEEGEEISSRRPTDEEAMNTHVIKVLGHPDRVLVDIV